MPKATLTTVIQKAIRDSGMSVSDLAKASGVHWGQLSRFTTGKRDFTLTTAEKLCKVLGLELTATRRKKGK